MGNKGYSTIPGTLFESITFLAGALPIRSVPTFIELLIGAKPTQAGFFTEASLAIHPLRSWSAYYKWLQEGKYSFCPVPQVHTYSILSFKQLKSRSVAQGFGSYPTKYSMKAVKLKSRPLKMNNIATLQHRAYMQALNRTLLISNTYLFV